MIHGITASISAAGSVSTDTGWVLIGSPAESTGSPAWTTLTGPAVAGDGTFASCTAPSDDFTGGLRGEMKANALSVPTSTINGIEFKSRIRASGACVLYEVFSVKAGANTGTGKIVSSSLTGSFSEFTQGGAADLWGTTWTVLEVNNAGFGFSYNILETDDGGNETASVSEMWVKVYYTT
jgi:hypothetical protein